MIEAPYPGPETAISSDREYSRAIAELEARWERESRSVESPLTRLIEDIETYERAGCRMILPGSPASDETVQEESDEKIVETLISPVVFKAFVGWRSAIAALRAHKLLFSNDPQSTAFWMSRKLLWSEFTPLQLAEQGDEELQMVLDHIGRIEAGVYY